ncbi:MAG: hypothetical protein KDD36_10080 [Flavobacteriales bacterium]|nr:hypothetical protein [Flavobacteriales bacterium]
MKRTRPSIILINQFSIGLVLLPIGIFLMLPNYKGEEVEPLKIPVIVGNKDSTSLCLSPNYMLNAWYHVERLDSIADTLDISIPGKNTKGLYFESFELPEFEDKLIFSNDYIQVMVDTVNELTMQKKPIWASYLFHDRLSNKDRVVLQDDTLIQQVKSFPIYIANLSNIYAATLKIQDGSMIMSVEAVDEHGEWKPIEYWSHSWCGNSYYEHIIPPRHFLMTRGIKCSGDFETKCRLKLINTNATLYSNEFIMLINKTQFENPTQKDTLKDK